MAHRAIMGLYKNLKVPEKKVKLFKNLLVLDFEATCIKNEILQPQEIIEFPCIVLSGPDWKVKDVFHKYVKPEVHPNLSIFCTELTGIMQETVDNEEHFPEVFQKFCQWLEEGEYFSEEDKSAFVTSGDWDLKVMLPKQCQLNNIELPKCFKKWINIKTAFCAKTNYYPKSLKSMLSQLDMDFQGRCHSGIDDAHNIVRIIKTLSKKYGPEFKITTDIEKT